MKMRSMVACMLLALCCAAQAQDPLGGRYRPADNLEDAAGELRLEADGDGWQAWFGGSPRRLEPVPQAQLAETFGDLPARSGLQCAASPQLLLCAVKPGTQVAVPGDAGFVAATGYFAMVGDAGLFHLRKLP